MLSDIVVLSKDEIKQLIADATALGVKQGYELVNHRNNTKYLKVEDAASRLGVSIGTLNNRRRKGLLKECQKMGKVFYVF